MTTIASAMTGRCQRRLPTLAFPPVVPLLGFTRYQLCGFALCVLRAAMRFSESDFPLCCIIAAPLPAACSQVARSEPCF